MPQKTTEGSPPASGIPTDLNLQCIEHDVHVDLMADHKRVGKKTFFFYGSSDPVSDDDIPSSQESAHSQGFEMDCSEGVTSFQPFQQSSVNSGHKNANVEAGSSTTLMSKIENVIKTNEEFHVPFVPRNSTPVSDIGAEDSDGLRLTSVNEVTPTKSFVETDPLTPTANLKMLISAASPEIRNREKLKSQCKYDQLEGKLFTEEAKCTDRRKRKEKSADDSKSRYDFDCSGGADVDIWATDGTPSVSRKEKSLGLLCQRFLAKYPEFPGPLDKNEICLDEVAKELVVERRRIYDIVNVLESVEMVSRLAKNRYTWHGKTNLPRTLTKLKVLGEQEGYVEQICKLPQGRFGSRDEETSSKSECKQVPLKNNGNNAKHDSLNDYLQRNPSLRIMSRKFLMLFLVSQHRAINLDLAAKIITGDSAAEEPANAKFKTKIRRLYDIANILTSLDLICKVHVTQLKGRKPAFKYIGPNMQETSRISVFNILHPVRPSTSDAQTKAPGKNLTVRPMVKRTFSRHASFDQICEVAEKERKRLNFESMSPPSSPTKPKAKSKNLTERPMVKRSLSRHASFDQICQVAEKERKRLNFEPMSPPSSPTKPKAKRVLLPKTKSMTLPINHMKTHVTEVSQCQLSDKRLKHVLLIRNDAMSRKERTSPPKSTTSTQKPQPEKPHVDGKEQQAAIHEPPQSGIFKAQTLPSSDSAKGQPTIVRLSKNQLETIVKKMSVVPAGESRTNHQEVNQVPVYFTKPTSKSKASVLSPNTGLVSLINTSVTSAPTPGRHVPKVHLLRMASFPPPPVRNQPSHAAETMPRDRGPGRKRTAKQALPDSGRECTSESDSKQPRIAGDQDESASTQDDEAPELPQSKPRLSPCTLCVDTDFKATRGLQETTPSPEGSRKVSTKPGKDFPTVKMSKKPTTPISLESSVDSPPQHTVMVVPPQVVPITQPNFGWPSAFCSTPLSTTSTVAIGGGRALATNPTLSDGTKLKLSSSGIAALGAIDTTPTLGHTLFSPSMMSPISLGISPMGFSQGNFAFQPVSGVQPSSNAIINLIPHLNSSPVGRVSGDTVVNQIPIPLPKRQTSNCAPQSISQTDVSKTQRTSSAHTDLLLTPQNHILSPYGAITPTQKNPTANSLAGKTPATPSTFFGNTPGGFYSYNPIPHLLFGQTVSAFQPLGAKAKLQNTNAISSATARRLSMVDCDLPPF